MREAEMPLRFDAVVGIALLCLLSACAETNTIYHNRTLITGPRATQGDAKIITLDAKQRSLIASKVEGQLAVCAEAPPDAFSALSTSAAGELGVRPDAGDLQARAAIALAEAAGTIERTQTVNLLRESMYRTCERYLSGAIGRSEFVVQSARDSRNMVAVLAIEQLTGVVRAPSTILVPGATSAAVKSPADTAFLIQNAAEKKALAEAEVTAADKQWADAGGKTVCDPLLSPAATVAEADLPKKAACEAAKARQVSATTKAAEAKTSFDALMEVAKAGGLTATMNAATTPAGTSLAGGVATTNPPAGAGVEHVAKAVQAIVAGANEFNEIEMMCVRIVLDNRNDMPGQVKDSCAGLIAAKADVEASQYMQRVAALQGVRVLGIERRVKEGLIDQILMKSGAPEDWRTGASGQSAPSAATVAKLQTALTAAVGNANLRNRIIAQGTTVALLGAQLDVLERDELAKVLAALS